MPVRLLLATASVALWLSSSARGEAVTSTGEAQQPRNIYELVYAFDHTFRNILKGEAWDLYRTRSPEQLRQTHPALYERISKDVKAWTDIWIHHVRISLDPIPEKRLDAARRVAAQVDGILRTHFDDKDWPYKPLRVVFLPPQVFLDERDRRKITSGMFIPFYPDAFFASVDWPAPMELVLAHESLHYNATGVDFGPPLTEGITETATRYLTLKYGLLTARVLRRVQVYPLERKGVELILEEIMKRTTGSREEALEMFLEAYLTGHQDGMERVFGAEPWKRVLRLSQSEGGWQTHKIMKALEK